MKISGSDEVIKLLLEVKVSDVGINNHDRTENLEKTLQKVDDIIHKDVFIRSGKANNIKAEIQFTKNLNESPEAYLYRISTEVINQRELDQTNLNDSEYPNKSNRNEIAETAARTGLLKDFMLSKNEDSNKLLVYVHNKWLLRVNIVFMVVILIYSILSDGLFDV